MKELKMEPSDIHRELKIFVANKFKIDPKLVEDDPTFEEMNADSMTRLEILLHADDTYGSHVLDYIEDGILEGNPPERLSELAILVPKCLAPVSENKLTAGHRNAH
jgi:hypothetical protein